jgi:hypothetical protein
MEFSLPIPDDARRRLAVGWLTLGLAALVGSGLYSVLLVLARVPFAQRLFARTDFFHTALVVHVDLSVLVWFIAFGGLLWTLNSTPRWLALGWAAIAAAALGALLLMAAPLAPEPGPLMSNYIPVLRQPLFLAGLLLFALGSTLLVLRAMIAIPPVGMYLAGTGALRFGLNTAAVATVLALIAFAWSYVLLPSHLEGRAFYELLFWGGGHVLQFSYTLLMLVAWLWLAAASGVRLPLTPRVTLLLFALGLVTVFLVPVIYYSAPVTAPEHIKLFTWLMQYGGSLAALPLSLAVTAGVLRSPRAHGSGRPLRAALIASIVLFGVGGGIGFLIQGSNVTIPAHYHGSIVGVTLAFMGLTYHLLPQLGFAAPHAPWARLQPWLYGVGQLLHVGGLVWSGGYGVQRKVAGAEQGLRGFDQLAGMALMGLGGLIAILGGLLFLLIVLRAIARAPRRTPRRD